MATVYKVEMTISSDFCAYQDFELSEILVKIIKEWRSEENGLGLLVYNLDVNKKAQEFFMRAKLELEFDLPEEMDEYKTYMQAADASSALWKIKETFHGRNKWAETNCEFHEEVYELICNIIGEYNISL